MTIELRLASYAHEIRFDEISQGAIETARSSLIDILGVTLAGQSRPEIRLLQRVVGRWGGSPDCSVLGTLLRLPPPSAALLNGAASRVLDFDDVVDPLGIHPSVAVFAPLAAVAGLKRGEVDGRDLLAAMAIGQDLCTRLARVRRETLLESGRYDLSKVIGGAAAAARLFGLDRNGILAAMGIAYTSALGEAQCMVEGAPTVSYQQGLVAANAVRAVLLAAEGFDGAHSFLTGRYGLFSAFEPGSKVEDMLAGLGTTFAGDSDIAYKPYPTCRPNISAACLALELSRRAGFYPEDIARVEISMNRQIFDLVCAPPDRKWRPSTPIEARFGMAYTVAAALVGGDVSIDDYDARALSRPNVLALSELVVPRVDPRCEIAELGTHGRIALSLITRDGRREEGFVDRPKGNPSDPMTREEIVDKFFRCITCSDRVTGCERARSMVEAIDGFDADAGGVDRLFDLAVAVPAAE